MNVLGDSLRRLGYATYGDYLLGPHWAAFRRMYVESRRPHCCAVCGLARYQLHHVTYANLGAESLDDVVPLCDAHHGEVHEWLRGNGLSLEDTPRAVASIRDSWRKEYTPVRKTKSEKKAIGQANKMRQRERGRRYMR